LVILFTPFLRRKIQEFLQLSVIEYINKTGGSNRAINETKMTFPYYRQITRWPTSSNQCSENNELNRNQQTTI
jgi:hypothetical protein